MAYLIVSMGDHKLGFIFAFKLMFKVGQGRVYAFKKIPLFAEHLSQGSW